MSCIKFKKKPKKKQNNKKTIFMVQAMHLFQINITWYIPITLYIMRYIQYMDTDMDMVREIIQ